jgi:hypothetical protein
MEGKVEKRKIIRMNKVEVFIGHLTTQLKKIINAGAQGLLALNTSK